MKTTAQWLGEWLTRVRGNMGVQELASKVKTPEGKSKSRAWIYAVEEGNKNFTVEEYDRLLAGCGKSADAIFAGSTLSEIPSEFHDLYWNLVAIIRSSDKDLIHGTRTLLDSMARSARGSPPGPSLGVKHGGETGPQARSLMEKRKKRRSG